MNLKAIASAATIVARTALAATYDDGSYDYKTASAYALDAIGELSYDNGVMVELANCLLVDGNCNMLNKYAAVEAKNEADRTGIDVEVGESLGMPPDYYVGVYKIEYGQPFVRPTYLCIIPYLRSHTSFFATDSPDDIVCSTRAQHKRPCKHCTEGYTILEEVKQRAKERLAGANTLLEKQHMDEILHEINVCKSNFDEYRSHLVRMCFYYY
jgi:hypothetical protein